MTENQTPALPDGSHLNGVDPAFDPADWRDRLTAAGNAYLFARARYHSLPKSAEAVFATLPPDATALDRYNAVERASSDVRATYSACCDAGAHIARTASELVNAATIENPVMVGIIERSLSDAAARERSAHLEADTRAARYRKLEAEDAAADEVKAAEAALTAARARARSVGLPG